MAKLQRVGRAEIYLRQLGWTNIRVRSQGETARIEVSPQAIQRFVNETDLEALTEKFQELGFLFVTLDLEGYKSGKLNRGVEQKSSQ